ncbi:MAG: hypothetical protein ABIO70_21335 [Pseudomonadota bacterium]
MKSNGSQSKGWKVTLKVDRELWDRLQDLSMDGALGNEAGIVSPVARLILARAMERMEQGGRLGESPYQKMSSKDGRSLELRCEPGWRERLDALRHRQSSEMESKSVKAFMEDVLGRGLAMFQAGELTLSTLAPPSEDDSAGAEGVAAALCGDGAVSEPVPFSEASGGQAEGREEAEERSPARSGVANRERLERGEAAYRRFRVWAESAKNGQVPPARQRGSSVTSIPSPRSGASPAPMSDIEAVFQQILADPRPRSRPGGALETALRHACQRESSSTSDISPEMFTACLARVMARVLAASEGNRRQPGEPDLPEPFESITRGYEAAIAMLDDKPRRRKR